MADKPTMTLSEARGSIRKVLEWADAVRRFHDILDAAVSVEEDVGNYQRKQQAMAAEMAKAREAHKAGLAELAAQRTAEVANLETHKRTVAAAKAEVDAQLDRDRKVAEDARKAFSDKAEAFMANLRAEQASLMKEVENTRSIHNAELHAMASERIQLEAAVKTLYAEKQRVLSQFAGI